MAHELEGRRVDAETWADPDRDLPATRVSGPLAVQLVRGDPPETGYDQLWVGGVQVNPATVKPAE